MYALPTAMFSLNSTVSIGGRTSRLDNYANVVKYENIQLYAQCVLHTQSEDFYLNRITLPALAYGASLSGITVEKSDSPHGSFSHCEENRHSAPLGGIVLQKCAHYPSPFQPGLALSFLPLLRPRTANHFWKTDLRLTYL